MHRFLSLLKIVLLTALYCLFSQRTILCLSIFSQDKQKKIFSSIEIASTNAHFSQDKKKSLFYADYTENVIVTLADQSSISSNSLHVEITEKHLPSSEDTQKTENSLATDKKKLSDINQQNALKKICFRGNVSLKKELLNATADELTVLLPEQKCLLSGNVHVTKKSNGAGDTPFSLSGQKAIISLENMSAQLIGSQRNPVKTTLSLDNNLATTDRTKRALTSSKKIK